MQRELERLRSQRHLHQPGPIFDSRTEPESATTSTNGANSDAHHDFELRSGQVSLDGITVESTAAADALKL